MIPRLSAKLNGSPTPMSATPAGASADSPGPRGARAISPHRTTSSSPTAAHDGASRRRRNGFSGSVAMVTTFTAPSQASLVNGTSSSEASFGNGRSGRKHGLRPVCESVFPRSPGVGCRPEGCAAGAPNVPDGGGVLEGGARPHLPSPGPLQGTSSRPGHAEGPVAMQLDTHDVLVLERSEAAAAWSAAGAIVRSADVAAMPADELAGAASEIVGTLPGRLLRAVHAYRSQAASGDALLLRGLLPDEEFGATPAGSA